MEESTVNTMVSEAKEKAEAAIAAVHACYDTICRKQDEAAHNARKAYDAYFSDAKKREDQLGNRAKQISKEIEAANAELSAAKKRYTNAVLLNDETQAEHERKNVDGITGRITALMATKDALTAEPIPYSKELYDAWDVASEEYSDAMQGLVQDALALYDIVKALHNSFDDDEETSYYRLLNRSGQGFPLHPENIYVHFHHQGNRQA